MYQSIESAQREEAEELALELHTLNQRIAKFWEDVIEPQINNRETYYEVRRRFSNFADDELQCIDNPFHVKFALLYFGMGLDKADDAEGR